MQQKRSFVILQWKDVHALAEAEKAALIRLFDLAITSPHRCPLK